MKKKEKAFCILFDGLPGSGRETQADLLKDRLLGAGYDVVCIFDPSEGERVSSTLDPTVQLLLEEASRRQLYKNEIKPALRAKKVVILHGHRPNTYANLIFARGACGEIQLGALKGIVTEGWVPNVWIYQDISAQESRRRRGFTALSLAKLKIVLKGFEVCFTRHSMALDYVRIKGRKSIATIHDEIIEVLVKRFGFEL